MKDIVVVSVLSNLDMLHIQWDAFSIHFENTFVCRVDVQSVFKNVGRNKEVYTTCKSEADSTQRNRS